MLRIITGIYRGRKLAVPPSTTTRPTSDRVRESIFNVLESHMAKNGVAFDDLTVLDAFAGSGALGFEALSRGARSVIFFEQAPAALKILQENAAYLKVKRTDVKILRLDATHSPKAPAPAGLVFLDPPYEKDLLKPTYEALYKMGWIGEHTLTILESALKDPLDPLLMTKALSTRAYGSTVVTLLRG